MTSSVAATRYRSTCAFWAVILLSVIILTMIAGVTLAMSPSFASAAPSTPRPPSWAAVSLAKPTYTPSPVPTSTATPVPTSTATPIPTIEVAIPAPETSPAADPSGSQDGQAPLSGKYILVSISDQHLTAYENDQLVYSFVASTGRRNSTRIGSFKILDKIDNAYGSTWDIWMPEWMGIYYSGTLENGIHALPILPDGNTLWAGFLGTPISFGCVVLGTDDAVQLYNWADIGTPVEIRW